MARYCFITLLCLISIASYAHPPWGIAVDQSGNVYFADITHNGMGSVWKLTQKGKLELLLKDFHAHNVNLDQKGRLVTAHGENNHTMVRLSDNGKLDTLFHTLDLKAFFGGNCTYSKQGNIYFKMDHHVWQIDASGKKHKFNPKRLEWSQTIYVDDQERVYVPEIGGGRADLYRLTADGQSELIASNLITRLNRPRDKHNDVLLGITQDEQGIVYIAETAGRRIIKIDGHGGSETYYQPKSGWTPCAITFHNDKAYVLEYDLRGKMKGPRVTIVNANGKSKTLFDYDTYQDHGQMEPLNDDKGAYLYLILVIAVAVGLAMTVMRSTKRLSL
ncbi:MAG: hypothetical protein AAFX87_17705 [Bacteroidota bacterium]